MLLSEEQQMVADLAERLLADKADVDTVRAIRDGRVEDKYDRALWAAVAEAGLTGIVVPEAHGGMAFGLVGGGLVAREIGRRLAMTPYVSSAIIAATALARGANDTQRARWLPGIASGRLIATLACDEGRRHRPQAIRTRASDEADGCRIKGEKTLVLDALDADLLLVSAIGNGGQARLFAVDAQTQGVHIEPTRLLDSRSAARVRFDAALAEPLDGADDALDTTLRAGRAILAAELVGIAKAVFERTLTYLHERKQFGQPIGAFQALQHRAAHVGVEIAIAEAMAFRALAACDAQADDAEAQVFAAKAKAADVARLATAEAVQMHGGMGMTDEFDIGLFMKRARAAGETLGDANYCADAFARWQGY